MEWGIASIAAMNQSKLFSLTRWRLAGWYASVMGIILTLSSLGFYEAVSHAHRMTLDRELVAVAGTLHDSIEPVPKQPRHLEHLAQQLSSNICLPQTQCVTQTANFMPEASSKGAHVLGAIHQGDYYLRLLNRSGQIVVMSGLQPEELPLTSGEERWQTIADGAGRRYHQISLTLHTHDNRHWGYMQVGRSLNDIDQYLAAVRLTLLLGLPVVLLLVGGSSWWLAGLAMQPIHRSYQQMQQFTADAAHELRTPLAATQATVESALRTSCWSGKEGLDVLQTIERQNNRLAQLVKDLLLLSRTEQQVPSGKYRPCCLNDIVNDLVEELATLAIPAQVKLTAKIQMQKPLYVLGDEEQLYRLVSNLIANAIQYTPGGGQVTVNLARSDHHASIQVQDTGIGIAPVEQSRIFNRFYRVNSDRSRQTGGAGLGLPIARMIAQAHHSDIQVQSQPGQGSTFIVRLPLYERFHASVV